jgi:prepilin-type N-terminal cleavage/methylation domain-containing protein
MKNRKGFTLVELIVVVGLLSLMAVAVGVSLNRSIKNQNETSYEEFVAKVVSSANLYASNNKTILDSLYSDKGFVMTTVQDIIDEGYLSKNTINPETNKLINGEDKVKITLDSTGFISIEYPTDGISEDYLWTLDIIVEYGSDTLSDYCYSDLNENVKYVQKDGTILSEYLVKDETIKCTSEVIDSTKIGTYELNYEYLVKDSGVWKKTTRNVIVADNIKPVCGEVSGASTTWTKDERTITVGCQDNYKCEEDSYTETFSNIKTGYIKIKDVVNNETSCEVNAYTDSTKPSITFSKESSTTWEKSKEVTVTIQDDISGLASGGTVKYGWSTSKTTAPSSYTTATLSYTDGAPSITFTASNSTLTGQYYLWVVPTISDVAGNSADTKISSGLFYFDNEKPTCSLTVDSTKVSFATKNDSQNNDNLSYGMNKTGTAVYNSTNKLTSISPGTYYGYVKDSAGNTNSCSLTVSSKVVSSYTKTTLTCKESSYTCRKSASKIYYCPDGYTGGTYSCYKSSSSNTTATKNYCSQYTSSTTCNDHSSNGCHWSTGDCSGSWYTCSSGTLKWDSGNPYCSTTTTVYADYNYYYSCSSDWTNGDDGYCYKYKQSSCSSSNIYSTNYAFSSSTSTTSSCSTTSSFTCNSSKSGSSYVSSCTAIYSCPNGTTAISGTSYCYNK